MTDLKGKIAIVTGANSGMGLSTVEALSDIGATDRLDKTVCMRKGIYQMSGFEGKVAVITGAGGIICGTMAREMAKKGVKIALLDLFVESAQKIASTESTCPHRQLLNMIAGLKTMNAEIITPAFCENDFVAILYAR